MVKTWTSNRTLLITSVLFVIAFVICGIAWARFFSVIILNASPARYVDFISASGEHDPFLQKCTGPAFYEQDVTWRFCEYHPDLWPNSSIPQWGLVRFDLAAGSGELLWPLPEDPTAQILALAGAPGGDLAVAWGMPSLSAVYRVQPNGGVEALNIPAGAGSQVNGLAWAGDTLELVTSHPSGSDTITIWTHTGGEWDTGNPVTAPVSCTEGTTVCQLQFAQWQADDWRFLYAQAPVQISNPATSEVALVWADRSGADTPLTSVPLAEMSDSQYSLNEQGELVSLGIVSDTAPGNVINWAVDAAPFMQNAAAWERVAAPVNAASFYFSNYAIEQSGGLRWIPGLRAPERSWLIEEWVTLWPSNEGIALSHFNGKPGPTLSTETGFALQRGNQAYLLPASGGGYWLLGPNGAYLEVSDDLERADQLTILERIQRTYDNFGRLDNINPSFYRQRQTLKMAALPVVLLSLPMGYLLVFFVRQAQKQRRAWMWVLAQVSAAYVVLATMFIWWFWEIMNNF